MYHNLLTLWAGRLHKLLASELVHRAPPSRFARGKAQLWNLSMCSSEIGQSHCRSHVCSCRSSRSYVFSRQAPLCMCFLFCMPRL